jgi:hypothetical protein
MLDRLPTLAELGNASAFLASDRASAMTAPWPHHLRRLPRRAGHAGSGP